MKLVLHSIAALACSLASAATAQQVGQVQPAPTKSGAKALPQTKSGQINLGTTSPSTSANPRPGGFVQVVGGGAETCAAATVISGPGTHVGNNIGAALETQINCAAAAEVGDVWYSWTATATGSQTMATCPSAGAGASADYDTMIAVYNTSCGGAMVACNDDGPGCDAGPIWESTVQFGVTAGNVFKIQVAGFDSGTGFGNYSLLIRPVDAPPANNACTAPTAIAGAGPHAFNNTFGTRGAEHQAEAVCTQFGVAPVNADVWYAWTAGFTGSARLSTCGGGNTVDTKMGVYAPAGVGVCPAGAPLSCNDDLCGSQAQLDWPATSGSVYRIQMGTYPGGVAGDQGTGVFGGTGTFTIIPTPPGPVNDSCSTPIIVGGPGPHAFDNTAATAGVEGQAEGLCFASASTAIDRDVWFRWTAGSTGLAQLTTCSQTSVDTKIAAYTTSSCPASAAIGCNDDACGVQSAVCFEVKSGQTYMIQLGVFPTAAGGTGTFSIPISPPPPVCQCDDGTTENALGFAAGGEMVWMQLFGGNGSTGVSSIQVTWGSAAFPGGAPPNGSPSKVAIWDDPTDDGDPSDAVLIQVVNTIVANVDTDTFNTIPITPVVMNKRFFLGAGEAHSPGQFVAPMDQSCPIAGRAWFFGNNNATPADYTNVQNNLFPPASLGTSGFPAVVMVRGSCTAFAGITMCEPGINGVMACPCGNAPSGPGRGCNNSSNTGGATLGDIGVASLSADTLVFNTTGELLRAPSIVLQGSTEILNGVPFGDGVRCVDNLLRLYTKNASGGSITAPQGGDPTVSARSAALGSTIIAGQMRYYMVYYRDRVNFACPQPGSATFNTSSSKRILWNL